MRIGSRWPFVGRDGELAGFRAALADPGCDGLLVYGSSGVGKTRFAEECVTAAAAVGRVAARAATSTAGTGVPLGALAHLMPPDLGAGRFDPPAVFARVAAAIRDRSAGAAVVLFVDDIPLLDRLSLIVLGQPVAGGSVFLLGTAGSGQKFPPGHCQDVRHRQHQMDKPTRLDPDEVVARSHANRVERDSLTLRPKHRRCERQSSTYR